MNATVKVDRCGRVVIPKALRDKLRLEPGDVLALESEGERITLRTVRSSTPIRKEQGVWVFRTGGVLPAAVANEVLHESRLQRDRHNRSSG